MTRRHRHFPTIKSVDGVGISKWHEARLTKGRPGEILARDTVCGGPCCAAAPLPRTECAGTHMAEPLLAFRLGQPVKKRAARPAPVEPVGAAPSHPQAVRRAAAPPSASEEEELEETADGSEPEAERVVGKLTELLEELGTGGRRDSKLVAFAINEPGAYELLLLSGAVREAPAGLTQTACTGHRLQLLPGADAANRAYFVEADEATVMLWSADSVCIAADVLPDAVVSEDPVAVPGQLDARRMHVPDAVHAELLLGAERCHDGRWFECAAAAGGD